MRHGSRAIPSCTAQKDSGQFCDLPSLPEAPFPICIKHAAKILRYLNSVMPDDLGSRIILAARDFDYRPAAQRPSATAGVGIVYYLRVGDKLKVGFTRDLRQRLNSYPPDSELLGVEPGDLALEQKRHAEFSRWRKVAREWYEPTPELMAHVARLTREYVVEKYLPVGRRPATEPLDKYGNPVLRRGFLR